MDQFTRRMIGFGIHAGTVDGIALCRMFTTLFEATAQCQNSSARTTIRFIAFINGRPIYELWI
jgi:hypothetical protein